MTQQPCDITKNTDKIPHDDCSKEYFDNFGQWQGEPLQRPEQLPIEERLPFNEVYSEKIMLAFEFLVDIDQNRQIHLQLPETVKARKAKVIVMYEDEATQPSKPLKLGLFEGKIKISDDFDEPLTFLSKLPNLSNNG